MRSKAIVTLLSSLLIIKSASSQAPELLVQGQTGNLYLEHTVVARENWYSIGRLYNVDAKVLAAFNHLAPTKPLAIGQQLQVPLNPGNFSQTGQKAPGMTLVPVYHIIQDKEWLYRISINHNKVPVTSLEKWNNTDKDHAFTGMHLVVGFLKVKTSLSALANPAMQAPANAAGPGGQTAMAPVEKPKPIEGKTSSAQAATNPQTTAVEGKPKPPEGTPGSPQTGANPQTTTAEGKPKPTEGKTGSTQTTANQTDKNKGKVAPASTGTTNSPAPKIVAAEPAVNFNGGFFKSDYGETGKSLNGMAGVFKSTSGWQDGKYYALMNNVAVGTIVKVTDPGSGKSVFTKVLGALPDMKESAGLSIRISNAAAGELGLSEGKFQVDVRY